MSKMSDIRQRSKDTHGREQAREQGGDGDKPKEQILLLML
jgi:hypothetical protein